MIREAHFWKEDIAADRDRLARIAKQRAHGRKTMVAIEKCVFVTFYAIRKLMECGHLPQSARGWSIPVRSYPPKERSKHDIDAPLHQLINLDTGTDRRIDLACLCDRVIHSRVFVIQLSPKAEIQGFFVGSHPKRDSAPETPCLYIDIGTVLTTFTKVVESRAEPIEPIGTENGCPSAPLRCQDAQMTARPKTKSAGEPAEGANSNGPTHWRPTINSSASGSG